MISYVGGNKDIRIEELIIIENFSVEFLNSSIPDTVVSVVAYFTTEKNAFGATTGVWVDGQVYPLYLKPGTFSTFSIYKVTSYKYIKSTCSEQSFYQSKTAPEH